MLGRKGGGVVSDSILAPTGHCNVPLVTIITLNDRHRAYRETACDCLLEWCRPKHNSERGRWCDHCDRHLTVRRFQEAKRSRNSLVPVGERNGR